MTRTPFLAAAVATAALIGTPMLAEQHGMTDTTILETVREAGDFEILLRTAEAAGLAEILSGEGPFTVFAPTDDAFEALPEGMLDTLLKEQNHDRLRAILSYHVAGTRTMSGDLTDAQTIQTVNGGSLEVSIEGDEVMIGAATVTDADIASSNGVIHVIDAVLMPPEGKNSGS